MDGFGSGDGSRFRFGPGNWPVDARGGLRLTADRGFSIVEILLVCFVLGIIAAIGAPRLRAAQEYGRVTKAIADIRSLDLDIQSYFTDNGCFPASLADLKASTTVDPWGRPYVYQVLPDKGGGGCTACADTCVSPGQARKDRKLVPINSDFDLFSMGPDGTSTGPLTAKASQDDIVRGSDGAFVGQGKDY
jgi:general secretion pathway protein G